jgi:hypothetical protein
MIIELSPVAMDQLKKSAETQGKKPKELLLETIELLFSNNSMYMILQPIPHPSRIVALNEAIDVILNKTVVLPNGTLAKKIQLLEDTKTPRMKKWWISWIHDGEGEMFDLKSPWWINVDYIDKSTVKSIVKAAIIAPTEELAVLSIKRAYRGVSLQDLTFISIDEQKDDWNPFDDLHVRASWMLWPEKINDSTLPENDPDHVYSTVNKGTRMIEGWIHVRDAEIEGVEISIYKRKREDFERDMGKPQGDSRVLKFPKNVEEDKSEGVMPNVGE